MHLVLLPISIVSLPLRAIFAPTEPTFALFKAFLPVAGVDGSAISVDHGSVAVVLAFVVELSDVLVFVVGVGLELFFL